MRKIIFGPPGTGKTTYLLDKVFAKEVEQGVDPAKIGYFAFTRKAFAKDSSRIAGESACSITLQALFNKIAFGGFPSFAFGFNLVYWGFEIIKHWEITFFIEFECPIY